MLAVQRFGLELATVAVALVLPALNSRNINQAKANTPTLTTTSAGTLALVYTCMILDHLHGAPMKRSMVP